MNIFSFRKYGEKMQQFCSKVVFSKEGKEEELAKLLICISGG